MAVHNNAKRMLIRYSRSDILILCIAVLHGQSLHMMSHRASIAKQNPADFNTLQWETVDCVTIASDNAMKLSLSEKIWNDGEKTATIHLGMVWLVDILYQWWIIANWTINNLFQWNLNHNTSAFCWENALENVIAKCRPLCSDLNVSKGHQRPVSRDQFIQCPHWSYINISNKIEVQRVLIGFGFFLCRHQMNDWALSYQSLD